MDLRRAALITAVAAALAGGAQALDLGRSVELETVDLRFEVRGEQAAPDDVVIVGVDEKTLDALDLRWPFPRSRHAQVLDELREAEAKVIALDLQFTEQTELEEDNALVEAVDATDRVVLATTVVDEQGRTNVFGGDEVLADIGARVGSALLRADSGRVLRRLPYAINGLESFLVVAAELATGRQVDPWEDDPWLDFAGPPGTLEEISYVDVLRGRADPGRIRGKIVVIGTTSPRLKDTSPTSTTDDELMSGPEIQANAIATVLSGLPLKSPPGPVAALLLVLAAAVAPFAALRRLAVPAAGAFAVLLVLDGWLLFEAGVVLPLVHPLLALGLGLAGVVLTRRAPARAPAPVVEQGTVVDGLALPVPGAVLAGYRLGEVVGRGGMGVVFRAEDVALGRPVAVKVMAAQLAADPEFRARFQREARLAATLDHPHVVDVYAAGESAGHLYLAMRFVDGADLGARIAASGPLARAQAVALITQLAGALDDAHSAGLVHRDVKPANVLVADGHAFLSDFGVTRDSEATRGLTGTGSFVGSVEFAAPEQIRDGATSPASDQYALACVAFTCLTGTPPFRRETDLATAYAHMEDAPPPTGHPRADAAFARALAKDPADRFPSCIAFADAF